MVVVCVRGPLRKLAGGCAEHELEGAAVIELLRALELRDPEISGWMLDESGRIRRHIKTCSSTASAGARRRGCGQGTASRWYRR
jgi:hypothetical protein